jgi:hypothetical protein
MPAIDESQLRSALSAAERSRPNLRHRAGLAGPLERPANLPAIDQFLRTSFSKAGIDIEKLDRMIADEQSERSRRLKTQAAEFAKHLPAAREAFRRATDNQRRSLELLAGPPPSPQIVNLTPFIIFEQRFRYLVSTHIAPGDSWLKCLITARENTDDSFFDFWFLWENERDYPVVIDVSTSLVLVGHCFIMAAQGIFYGDLTQLTLGANLTLWEWWTNPQTPISDAQAPQFKYILQIGVMGRGIFSPGPHSESAWFDFQVSDLSYNKFSIPAKATAVFTVSFEAGYHTDDHLNISDYVLADFANGPDYGIICPGLQLDILTLPPGR